jgi:glutaminyl-peptide cyclotransferase
LPGILSKEIASRIEEPDLNAMKTFDLSKALMDLIEQVEMGPRIPGSVSHQLFFFWLQSKLNRPNWKIELQEGSFQGIQLKNIIAKNSKEPPKFIIGAHYDRRIYADQDPDVILRSSPVPGANDGASGVAVLLELARSLPLNSQSIWLVFFDAEDNGNLPGREWIMGSRYFVSQLETKPQAVIILDMIGDKDLNIYREINSDDALSSAIWNEARLLGYNSYFINEYKYAIIDDHIPFIEAGIPAVDIIDFDYPFWHTTSDTIDKVSSQSLEIVGNTILNWIIRQN